MTQHLQEISAIWPSFPFFFSPCIHMTIAGATGYPSSKAGNNLFSSSFPPWWKYFFLNTFWAIFGATLWKSMALISIPWLALTKHHAKRNAWRAGLEKGPGTDCTFQIQCDQMDFPSIPTAPGKQTPNFAISPQHSQGFVDLKPQPDCCPDPVHSLLDRGGIEKVTLTVPNKGFYTTNLFTRRLVGSITASIWGDSAGF